MRPMAYIRKHLLKMSQAEFAASIKVSQSTVSRWENGDLEPSRQEMAVIRGLAADRGIKWNDKWFFEAPTSEEDAAEEDAAETHRTGTDG